MHEWKEVSHKKLIDLHSLLQAEYAEAKNRLEAYAENEGFLEETIEGLKSVLKLMEEIALCGACAKRNAKQITAVWDKAESL